MGGGGDGDWDDTRRKKSGFGSGGQLWFSQVKRSLMGLSLIAVGFSASTLLTMLRGGARGPVVSGVSVAAAAAPPTVVGGQARGDAAAKLAQPPAGPATVTANATQLVRLAMGSSIRERLVTDQQREEYDSGLVSAIVGQGSCDALCSTSGGGACARDWFAHMDTCDVAETAFGRKGCTVPVPGQAAPGSSGTRIFAGSDSRDPPSCAVESREGETRLCPCVPWERRRQPAPLGVIEVGDAVLEFLEQEVEKQKQREREGHRTVVIADGDGDPKRLLSQAKSRSVTFVRGTSGQSCEDACKPGGLRCSQEWFSTLNRCEALMAAWPKAVHCSNDYYGHDLPGNSGQKSSILMNNDMRGYPSTCGGQGDGTERLCACVYRYPRGKSTFHTVFSVQSKQYFEWQSRYLNFWHKQVKQPGKITRLLSMGGAWPRDPTPHPFGDHLMKEIPTHIVPEYDSSVDSYTAYNKPLSVAHWLQTTTVTEDVIIILDPDCAFIEPSLRAVDEGSPIANQGYYTFKEKAGYELAILKHYCRGICTHFDPIAVPVIIHRNDLQRIAPLWLKYTEDIRRDREGPNKWPIQWNSNKYVVNRIEWVAEMFGYVLAAAHLGLRHEMVDLQMVPAVHRRLMPGVPFLHFHVGVETADKQKWGKQELTAGEKSPWPVAKGTDEVTTRLLKAVHDAREALGQTERTRLRKWGYYQAIWRNPNNETER